MKKLNVEVSTRHYPIYIEENLFLNIGYEISKIYKGSLIAVITDENVAFEYGNNIKTKLENMKFKVEMIVIKAGEQSKSLLEYNNLCTRLLDIGITRGDLIIAFGGGVVGDVAGFVAATLMRGIDYVQIPTTLLSQVDSSIGGKVAVDHAKGKNLIGSFYHPLAVFIDPLLLRTLKQKYLNDGMGEIIKYACIKNKDMFKKLTDIPYKECFNSEIESLIYECCKIKVMIVNGDEKDRGERKLLNFGHTIGHAIEAYYNFSKYTHGEAVAMGMYTITKNMELEGITKKGTSNYIKNLLEKFNLPLSTENIEYEKLIKIISLDKKFDKEYIDLVGLNEIGESFIKKVSKSELRRYLDINRKELINE